MDRYYSQLISHQMSVALQWSYHGAETPKGNAMLSTLLYTFVFKALENDP